MSETINIQITAEDLVKDIIMSDQLPRMREHLREMADAFVLSDFDPVFRRTVYSTYYNLDHFLAQTEQYVKQMRGRLPWLPEEDQGQ
jgi:hypothetical protein